MANRFLETNYFKSPYVRSLKGAIKVLYSFIICDCTPSGIWAKDMEAASMYIGFPVTDQDFYENFVNRGKAIELGNGKFFFPDFIEHQYPKGLQDNNAAHKNIIYELKKFELLDELNKVVKKKMKPLYSPFISTTGNGLGNSNGNGLGKEVGNNIDYNLCDKQNFPIPKMQTIWKKHHPNYAEDYKRDFPPLQNIWVFLSDQDKIKQDKRPLEEKVLEVFGLISEYVSTHSFFKNYSIKQTDTHIQSIITNIQNGATKSNGSSTLTERVQAKLKERLASGKQA